MHIDPGWRLAIALVIYILIAIGSAVFIAAHYRNEPPEGERRRDLGRP